MSNPIEPYSMIQKTNIKEHNDMINKINEIVDVINNTNLDTINTEISGLKAKATATDTEIANIKDKDTTQDTEINGITKSLVSNVTATFDNPSRELKISLGREASPSIDATVVIPSSSETGQYSAGNGITIQDYQIAVDTGVVALKTDIPVVPDISQLTADVEQTKTDIQTINTEIAGINNKNTEQDTAIAGKVAISQGTENAGKVLGIGSDGNVTPVDAGGSSGGDGWEEVDLNNFPTDWVAGDRIKFVSQIFAYTTGTISSWNNSIPASVSIGPASDMAFKPILEGMIGEQNSQLDTTPVYFQAGHSAITVVCIEFYYASTINTGTIAKVHATQFNGANSVDAYQTITTSNIKDYIPKMWRKRTSQ